MVKLGSKSQEIYDLLQASHAVTFDDEEPAENSIFFALLLRKPNTSGALFLWHAWRQLELYAPQVRSLILQLGKRSRWSVRFNWLEKCRYDGNAYADKALANGAAFAVVDNVRKHRPPQTILVDDVTETLYELARCHRENLDIPIVGVTGSVGKTTTKFLVQAVLEEQFEVASTKLSNKAVDLSQAILNITNGAEAAVFEIGTVQPGLLRSTCELVRPTHGLITTVGVAHLDTFGSLENIQEGKWEMFDFLDQNGGKAFVNMNHAWLASKADSLRNTLQYGSQSENDIQGELLSADPLLKVRWHLKDGNEQTHFDIQTQLAGQHNLDNVLAAIAVGYEMGIEPERICKAIENFQPVENRSEIIRWGSNVVYNESFQSNPMAVLANLDSFSAFSAQKKILILGYLARTEAAHPFYREVVEKVQDMDLDQVIFIGDVYNQFEKENIGLHFSSVAEASAWLKANPVRDTFVMLKGSIRLNLIRLLEDIPNDISD
ncbi:MAG: UDP-N-acetylmuramoyl-tripeptide--D-alanyl-D-alanine ligase [Anaerolineae bacterium]